MKKEIMTKEDALSYIPEQFIWAAALAFKAGEDIKGYEKNGWMDNPPSDNANLASFLGHIAEAEKENPDHESGLPAAYHVAARAIMFVISKIKADKEEVFMVGREEPTKIGQELDLDEENEMDKREREEYIDYIQDLIEQQLEDQDIEFNTLIYGPNTWKIWDVEALGVVPWPPLINWNKNDPFFNKPYKENYVLLYIPERVRLKDGKEVNVTLTTLQEISGSSYEFFSEKVKNEFGDDSASGWVLLSKKVIPDSRSKTYEYQKNMVRGNKGFRLPHALEVATLNLLVHSFTGDRLYGRTPLTYTRCVEKVDGIDPVVVGGFGPDGLIVDYNGFFDYDSYGAACALQFN